MRIVLAKLLTLSAAELADEIEIPEARARVLPAGVAIVAAIASCLRPGADRDLAKRDPDRLAARGALRR